MSFIQYAVPKRITKADLERLQKIRREASELKKRVDDLEDEVLDVVGYEWEGEDEYWDKYVDAMTDFLFNEGTIADLLLSLDITVEGDEA